MKEKKTSKEKKFLIGFAVLILAFSLVKGADAQYYRNNFSQRGNRSVMYQGYFYNFNYFPANNRSRWQDNPYYYHWINSGLYKPRGRRYYY
tara:strand:+ start:100 stop:372 length:273 start_codon:yes stop_codon:yes gene_type:complete